jgi:hypothetical protein
MSLLTELYAFFTEHQRCGELDAGVDGPVVWIARECGASMARRADEDDHAGPRLNRKPEAAVSPVARCT